jgi:REP element-mobilizing transposase RayT
VRRAFLWGQDRHSGKDFSHRKQWVVDRLAFLSEIFAVEVCAYAVMANHYHLVVRIDREAADAWSDKQVVERWQQLFSLPVLVARFQAGDRLSDAELEVVNELIARWRSRLHDLSWFMRCLNEELARRANAEDGCTGRFWEGRFKSQALLDEAGLLTCMAYVDLNPIRAGITDTPETSDFTSIYQRIRAQGQRGSAEQALRLKPFVRTNTDSASALPFRLSDYLELVDWTGRAIREDKRGHIPNDLPPILVRLNIDPAHWLGQMRLDGNRFGGAVGRLEAMRAYAVCRGQQWLRGVRLSRRLFVGVQDGRFD